MKGKSRMAERPGGRENSLCGEERSMPLLCAMIASMYEASKGGCTLLTEGRTSARHFKSPDSGLPKFGGTTSTEMYQSWKRLEKQQGKIVISDAGIVREGGFGNAMERERILEAVRFKLDYFFANNMADARNIFRKLDASGNCLLTRIEFEKAIKAMHVGFSMVQMKVLLDFVFENLSKDQSMGLEKLVNYVEFMNEFSPKSTSGLKVSRGRRGGRKKIVLDPAPEVEIDEEFIDEEKVDSAPFIILLTGFFVCPVWLFGINYVNSKKTSERLSAKLSLFLALAVFIIVVVVSTYYTNPGKGKGLHRDRERRGVGVERRRYSNEV
eukprot:53792-Hanusia_phi.AAC.3